MDKLLEKYLDIKFRAPIRWVDSFLLICLHLYGIIFGIPSFFGGKVQTMIFGAFIGIMTGFSITAGAHRLWAHRSYKAKTPFKVFLILWFSSLFEKDMYKWCIDHRLHHKYSDTDHDPHNAVRGFFFAHYGWNMLSRLPEVTEKEKVLDMSDILSDPVCRFEVKYWLPLKIIFAILLPVAIPVYLWGESPINAFNGCVMLKNVLALNIFWSVGSAAHKWGLKPYNGKIIPTDNLFVGITALGEGWHNYHHVFPWDYKSSEFGPGKYNFTTTLLNFAARFGWIYDLKEASEEMIRQTSIKHGDGSYVRALHEVPYEDKNGNIK